LEALGVGSYDLKTYNNVGHSISGDILRDVTATIATLIPHDTACIVQPKDPTLLTVKELMKAIKGHGLAGKAVGLSEKHELVKLLTDFYASKRS